MDKEIIKVVEKLTEKFSSWQKEAPSRLDIVEAHFDLDLLEYLVTPKLGVDRKPAVSTPPRNPICASPGCQAGWREGLVNQALPGVDPVWFCTSHVPDYQANGISAPPGTDHPKGPLVEKAREMSKAWPRFLERLLSEREKRDEQ